MSVKILKHAGKCDALKMLNHKNFVYVIMAKISVEIHRYLSKNMYQK